MENIGKQIAAQLDAIIKTRSALQKICDRLDESYDKKIDPKILKPLTAVQGCIDLLKDAEKELYNA